MRGEGRGPVLIKSPGRDIRLCDGREVGACHLMANTDRTCGARFFLQG